MRKARSASRRAVKPRCSLTATSTDHVTTRATRLTSIPRRDQYTSGYRKAVRSAETNATPGVPGASSSATAWTTQTVAQRIATAVIITARDVSALGIGSTCRNAIHSVQSRLL